MNMTPEEIFNRQVWEILQDIREEILATEEGKPVKYRIPNVMGVGIIPPDRRIKILYKLQEKKAFEIQRNAEGARIGRSDLFYLIINPLKFNSLCEEFRPKVTPKDEAYEEIIKKQKAEQALRPNNFTPRSTLPVNTSAEEVIKNFSPQNYYFVLTVIRGILNLIDFSPDGKVAYQLQSPPGQLLINERRLIDRLSQMGLLSHYGEDGIFGIVTIGNINVEVLREVEHSLTNAGSQNIAAGQSVPGSLSRRGLEKKWDVLQAIWSSYEASSRADLILVPIAALTKKDRSPEEIDQIIEGLRRLGCFAGWERKDRWYSLENLDHNVLPEIHDRVEGEYKDLAAKYQSERPLAKSITPVPPPTGIIYNATSHEILFAGKTISIPPNTDQDSLCITIFKNPQSMGKEWSWDEMLEKWGGSYDDKEGWRKVYNAGREVNKKVAIETTVKDLLLVRKRSVVVNPKHLK